MFLKYGFTLEIWGQKERYVDICSMLDDSSWLIQKNCFFHISWVETTKNLGYLCDMFPDVQSFDG